MSKDTNTKKALIFMTARNCEMYAAASLASLARQTHDDLHVLYVDDCSDDATGQIAERLLSALFPGKHTFVRNPVRFGKARNTWEHLRPKVDGAEFIAVLDGDDQLIEPEILKLMAKYYAAGKDVVWTNYVTDSGMIGGNAALDPEKSPRGQGWKSSHFFSFRAALLKNVTEDYFRDSKGEWLMAACDIALAFPVLDQTRRYQFIPANAYRYTALNPYSHHNLDSGAVGFNSTMQQHCANEVLRKQPLPLLRPLNGPASSSTVAPHTTAKRDVWMEKAADLLVVSCPTVLNAHSVLADNELSPMEVWALYQSITRMREGHVLHVGVPGSALYLAAIVACLPDVRLSCLTASEAEKADLEAKLAASRLAECTSIFGSEMTTIPIDEGSGFFVSTKPLDSEARFSTAIVDARGYNQEAKFLMSALPALAGLLDPKGFRLFLLAGDQASLRSVASHWQTRTSGMKFCLDGVGGGGLAVIAER